jgi:hypothetical protein
MKSWITWEELLVVLFAVGILYYGIILLGFYREQLKSRRANKIPAKWNREQFQQTETVEAQQPTVPSPVVDISSAVHELMQEIKEVFASAISDHLEQGQVLSALTVRLQKYPVIKSSDFREAINNHIAMEFQLQLSIVITTEEINQYW